jgi:D-amino-acid dehydrogenase
MPFGMRLLAASAPARFRAGCAAMRPLMAQALPAWQARAEAIGEPGLLRNDGHFVLWQDAAAAQAGQAAWEAADTGTATVRAATAPDLARLSALTTRPVGRGARARPRLPIWANCAALRAGLRAQRRNTGRRKGGARSRQGSQADRADRRARLVLDAVDRVLVCAGIRSRALMEGWAMPCR